MKSLLLLLAGMLPLLVHAQKPNSELQTTVDSFRQTYRVPAIAVSVIYQDEIRYAWSGTRSIENGEPIDAASKFQLSSNTKAITATIAARLVEKGVVDWKTTLAEAVPELRDNIIPAYRTVTLADFLSHRAGLPPFEDDQSSEWKEMPDDIETASNPRLAFATYALNLPLVDLTTGEDHYSNGGYIIAALMLEKQSGQSWPALVDAFFSARQWDYFMGFPSEEGKEGTRGHQRKALAFLSANKYRTVRTDEEQFLPDYFSPAGNLSLNLIDYSQFIQLHLRGLLGTSNILSADTYEYLHYGLPSYALGWYNGQIGDTEQRFSYHGGSLGTFSSAAILSADRQVAIVILINADGKQVTKLKTELRQALWQQYGIKG